MVDGMKKVTTHNNEDMLPQCIRYPQLYEEMKVCGPNGTKTRCEDRCMAAGLFNLISWLIYSRETLHFFYFKGDVRANENHGLTVIHTLWMREHNRIAKLLEQQHTNWNDEKLYQETRRIVIAEYQHITFNEWLPQILGRQFCVDCLLLPSQSIS